MSRLDRLLNKRRSVRNYLSEGISQDCILRLIEAAKKAPSAGRIKPITIHAVEGEKIKSLWLASGRQKALRAPLVFVFCADMPKMQRKYKRRGLRYAFLEIGHMAQNVCLKAVELELATCPVGAFRDGEVKEILGCEESPLYMIAIGKNDNSQV